MVQNDGNGGVEDDRSELEESQRMSAIAMVLDEMAAHLLPELGVRRVHLHARKAVGDAVGVGFEELLL